MVGWVTDGALLLCIRTGASWFLVAKEDIVEMMFSDFCGLAVWSVVLAGVHWHMMYGICDHEPSSGKVWDMRGNDT